MLLGVALLVLALTGYLATMATSFVFGDSAHYLNLANTGGLNDRGNGVPLYITTLNAAVHFPLPFQASDGVRCGFITVLFGVTIVMLSFRAGLRVTGNPASAFAAGLAVLSSGLVWSNVTWIMPHITLAFVSAIVLNLLLAVDSKGSSRTVLFFLGLACGLGFGLMPNAVLLLPGIVVSLWMILETSARRRGLTRFGLGTALGIGINVILIAMHESRVPTVSGHDVSIMEATWFYLHGGDEVSWFMYNVTLGHVLRGLARLPLDIVAEFESVGTFLALLGLWVGLRRRPSLHVGLVLTVALVAFWVGSYPGDTGPLHGLTAYPIVAFWLAIGAGQVLGYAVSRGRALGLDRLPPALLQIVFGAGLCAAMLAGIAGGKLIYREKICTGDYWVFEGFCTERVPEPAGDRYLVRARDAVMRVPEGALVLGAAWDATHQMNYFIRVHGTRADLDGALDLTKLDVASFEKIARPYWQRGNSVYLFGEWEDVEAWSPELLPHIDSRPQGEFLFELIDAGEESGP